MLASMVRIIQRFPVHADLLNGTVTSIENANPSPKWENLSRKLWDITKSDNPMGNPGGVSHCLDLAFINLRIAVERQRP